MGIGERLKELRTENGYTQAFVAQKLGITRQAYCRYEKDQRELVPATLVKLADLYDVTVDYIVGRTDEFGNKN